MDKRNMHGTSHGGNSQVVLPAAIHKGRLKKIDSSINADIRQRCFRSHEAVTSAVDARPTGRSALVREPTRPRHWQNQHVDPQYHRAIRLTLSSIIRRNVSIGVAPISSFGTSSIENNRVWTGVTHTSTAFHEGSGEPEPSLSF
jgi:hypothetical protein